MSIAAYEKDVGVFRFLSPICGHLKKSLWEKISSSFLTGSRQQCIHTQGWAAGHLFFAGLHCGFTGLLTLSEVGVGVRVGDARAPWFVGRLTVFDYLIHSMMFCLQEKLRNKLVKPMVFLLS